MKNTRKNRKRRIWRTERNRIEASLHPSLKIEGAGIHHEHLGIAIVFTAWTGDRRKNGVEVRAPRTVVLCSPAFYAEYGEELRKLAWKEAS